MSNGINRCRCPRFAYMSLCSKRCATHIALAGGLGSDIGVTTRQEAFRTRGVAHSKRAPKHHIRAHFRHLLYMELIIHNTIRA